jgi:hypothetical protein
MGLRQERRREDFAHEYDFRAVVVLDLGFPAGLRGGDHGGTALHAAAYAGSAETVRLLLDRGAAIDARDSTWNDTPLGWAIVGSGERPTTSPDPDWIVTVRTLIEAEPPLRASPSRQMTPSRPAGGSRNSCATMASATSSRIRSDQRQRLVAGRIRTPGAIATA